MVDEGSTNKWRQVSTYFTGKFALWVTFPILAVFGGILLAYVVV